jgi:spore cortex protein
LAIYWHPNHEKDGKRMRYLNTKTFTLGSLLFLLLCAGGCSVSMDEEVNPKTLDFTGRDTIGEDNSFDHTNGVEINSDHTGDHLDDKRMQITNTEQHTKIANTQTQIALEEVTADQVALIDDVSEAIIVETDNNAFVAVKLDNGTDTITDDLRSKITQVVTANVEHGEAVHIANNPEFYRKMQTYERYLKSGTPISHYINDFSETIRRIFPDAR